MGTDTKKKRSRSEVDKKESSGGKKIKTFKENDTNEENKLTVEVVEKKSKKDKKEKKEKKSKKSKHNDSDDDNDTNTHTNTNGDSDSEMEDLTEKKSKKEKKEKKDKKQKKEKKDKVEKEDRHSKKRSKKDSSSDADQSVESNGDVEMTTVDQQLTKKIVEIMIQEKKAIDNEKATKKDKKVVLTASISQDIEMSTESDSQKVDGLSKKERNLLKLKQRQLERKSQGDGEPTFTTKDGHELTLKELRDLVIFILTETPELPWIKVLNKFKIDRVLFLYASGMDPAMFNMNIRSSDAHKAIDWVTRSNVHGGPITEFKFLREHFKKAYVVKATGDRTRIFSPTNTLLNVPLSLSEKVKREKEKKVQKSMKAKPENFMMTLEQLRENSFPIPRYLDVNAPELGQGWIETPKLKKVTLTPPPKAVYAMDCEMCQTEAGLELTRVSLIDEKGTNILDEFVKPEHKIVDYLTQYSGMTADKLDNVTTTLADVQNMLREYITYDTILVGHSLENDMKVLKIAHPFIIDTSLIYHHTRGPPYRPGLKWLSQKWLQRHIQADSVRGHDSAEDALACMDLLKLKMAKPAGFGEFEQDQESLFSRLHRFNSPRTSILIDSDSFAGQAASETIRATNDEEVVAAIPEAVKKHNFIWARLRDIEVNHGKAPEQVIVEGQKKDTGRNSKISSAEKVKASDEEIRAGVRSIDHSLKQIYECIPSHTLVILTSGQGDHREVSKLQQRQKAFYELRKTTPLNQIPKEIIFTEQEEAKLEKAVEVAKGGIFFMTIKQ